MAWFSETNLVLNELYELWFEVKALFFRLGEEDDEEEEDRDEDEEDDDEVDLAGDTTNGFGVIVLIVELDEGTSRIEFMHGFGWNLLFAEEWEADRVGLGIVVGCEFAVWFV